MIVMIDPVIVCMCAYEQVPTPVQALKAHVKTSLKSLYNTCLNSVHITARNL